MSRFVQSAHPRGRAGQVAWTRPMNHDDLRREIERRESGVRHSDMYVKTGRHGGPTSHASAPGPRERERRFYHEDMDGLPRSITILDMGSHKDYRRAKELDRDPDKLGFIAHCYGAHAHTFREALARPQTADVSHRQNCSYCGRFYHSVSGKPGGMCERCR